MMKLDFKRYIHIQADIDLFHFDKNQGFRWEMHGNQDTSIILSQLVVDISLSPQCSCC